MRDGMNDPCMAALSRVHVSGRVRALGIGEVQSVGAVRGVGGAVGAMHLVAQVARLPTEELEAGALAHDALRQQKTIIAHHAASGAS